MPFINYQISQYGFIINDIKWNTSDDLGYLFWGCVVDSYHKILKIGIDHKNIENSVLKMGWQKIGIDHKNIENNVLKMAWHDVLNGMKEWVYLDGVCVGVGVWVRGWGV